MPGDGSDVWLDVRTVQLYLQISLTSIYKLIHQGEIPVSGELPGCSTPQCGDALLRFSMLRREL